MPGDYTRFTFKPSNDYGSLWRQQGRVGLDSDFNEMSEIADRRWRAETTDVIGRAAVSDFTTPDAFKITNPNPAAPGNFDIGVGRMYVDGLMAENHGRPPEQYDASLGEMCGTLPVPYTNQPYLPTPLPPALVPPPLAGRTDLVYLDVWQRELTFIEDPEIREIALGGPDTATRLQTIWQVRVLKGVGDKQCGSDIPEWNNLIAPSAGRLTTSTVAPPPSGDPCVITPAGGYRGLENRLYRVEVHTGGGIGTAKFKWSWDNASVASAVTGIEAGPPGKTKLRLRSLGRDRVLRFQKNDRIEMLDDFTEFSGHPPGQSGFMAKVDDVDEADQALILDRTVTPGLFDALNPGARHTRVRRWDQKTSVDANGLRTVTAGAIDLGDDSGIRITFSGQLRVGDFWVFAARTANGTIEELVQAPPRGALHHYARLAMIHWAPAGGQTTVDDCRPHWPPRSCCTFVVHPGESIQEALDALPDEGGCVCLKVGTHVITEPIRILKSNVTLHGETIGARVVRANGPGMLQVGGMATSRIDDVAVQQIRFEAGSESGFAWGMIVAEFVEGFTLEGCKLIMAEGRDGLPINPAAGVSLQNVDGALIAANEFERQLLGVWAFGSTRIEVSRNSLSGPLRSAPDGLGLTAGDTGVLITSIGGGCHWIERNRIESYAVGVLLGSGIGANSEHSTIVGNEIVRTSIAPSSSDPRFAIDVSADHAVVAGNTMNLPSELCAGISVVGLHALVENNHVDSSASSGIPIGIHLGTSLGATSLFSDDGVVRGNRLAGRQNAIVLQQLRNAEVADNQIEGPQEGFGILLTNVNSSRVSGNFISGSQWGILTTEGIGNHLTDNILRDGGVGLTAWVETALDITHNRVENMSLAGFLGGTLVATTRLAYNRFTFCGYQGGAGIFIFFAPGAVQIESCEVLNAGMSPDGANFLRPAYGIIGLFLLECLVHGNLVTYSDPTLVLKDLKPEDRALLLQGLLETRNIVPVSPQTFGDETFGFCAQVLDNKFIGPGFSALIEFLSQRVTDGLILRFERVVFNDNYCLHSTVPPTATQTAPVRATVQIRCAAAVVSGNQIKSQVRIPAVNFNDSDRKHVFIGNVVTQWAVGFGEFPAPQASFNIQR